MDNQMILSIGTKTVNNPQKYSVALENVKINTNQTTGKNEEEASWRLHIRDVKESDRGCYMCQVNTTPMLNQVGCVDVLVRPDILTTGTSNSDVIVKEGENATLECKATGRPEPTVSWRKEKNMILKRDHRDQLAPVRDLVGERLELIKVDRKQMGAYLCIATNYVPPGVSKRVYLQVHFSPTAKVKNQLVGAPLGTNVSLSCEIESFPPTINLWKRGEELVSISSGERFESHEWPHPNEEWKTTIELRIKQLQKEDLEEYRCIAKSSMGEAESTLRLYEIEGVTQSTRATSVSWKKLNRVRGNYLTTPKQTYSRPNILVEHKTTSAFIPEKRKFIPTTTSTTVDPRVPLTKDQNAFKHNEIFDVSHGSNVSLDYNIIVCLFGCLIMIFA
ncbi:hypothetical protein PV328_010641 [Microctonus aethiopoides]|uniref:Ig-like domain-containing protein n=1 Tax=Microctonus aethiopoides TaxID=144406 RepID=A0AA39FI87_9HYME|nr:hypothetical protein PV328_010641 [Microctonus aethiopoides]